MRRLLCASPPESVRIDDIALLRALFEQSPLSTVIYAVRYDIAHVSTTGRGRGALRPQQVFRSKGRAGLMVS